MKEFLAHYSVELRQQVLLGHCSEMLFSKLPDQLPGSLVPFPYSPYGVLYSMGLKTQRADRLPPGNLGFDYCT